MKKGKKILIDGKPITMQSLQLFLEGLEHSVITIMISCARANQKAEDLGYRIDALEAKAKRRRSKKK